jgi:hypothetical protein
MDEPGPPPEPSRVNRFRFEDKAEDEQNQHATDADVHSAKTEASPSAAFVASIFNVVAGPAWCPSHGILPSRIGC